MINNQRAKAHYDQSCRFHDEAVDALAENRFNEAITLTGLAQSAIELATFEVKNHALAAGIDDDAPPHLSHPTQHSGPRPWGGFGQ